MLELLLISFEKIAAYKSCLLNSMSISLTFDTLLKNLLPILDLACFNFVELCTFICTCCVRYEVKIRPVLT